jgi:hypothetical protein
MFLRLISQQFQVPMSNIRPCGGLLQWLPVFLLLLIASEVCSQTDSTSNITISGFIDAYYAFDFNKPQHHERPGFLYNHSRHNEFNVNLALLKAAYTADRVRGNLALMAGTYAQYNLAAEPSLLQHIYEASAGMRLGPDLWLDAGIFPSHIGAKSAVSSDKYLNPQPGRGKFAVLRKRNESNVRHGQ